MHDPIPLILPPTDYVRLSDEPDLRDLMRSCLDGNASAKRRPQRGRQKSDLTTSAAHQPGRGIGCSRQSVNVVTATIGSDFSRSPRPRTSSASLPVPCADGSRTAILVVHQSAEQSAGRHRPTVESRFISAPAVGPRRDRDLQKALRAQAHRLGATAVAIKVTMETAMPERPRVRD